MPAKFTEAEIEHMRQVAEECDYDVRAIAQRLCVARSTAAGYSSKRMLTRSGETLGQIKARLDAERFARIVEQHRGNAEAVASATFLSVCRARTLMLRAGFDAARRAQMAPPRRCSECGAEFHGLHARHRMCSAACATRNEVRRQRLKEIAKRGADPHALTKREVLEPQYRDALWRTFGNVHQTARIIGCGFSTARTNIKAWGLAGYVKLCRASEYDPDRLTEIIRDANWNIAAACRANGKRSTWFREMCRKAGAMHIATHAPCFECGCMCHRSGCTGQRTMCSRECSMAWRNRRERRARAARKTGVPQIQSVNLGGLACISSSPSSAALAATPK